MTITKKPSTVAREVHVSISPDKYITTPLQTMEIVDNLEQAVLSILEENGMRNTVAVCSKTGEPIYRVGGYKSFSNNPLLERMLITTSDDLAKTRKRADMLFSPRLVDEVCYHE